MKRAEEGGYDSWGVVFPGGGIREFSTKAKAALFIEKMEGQTVLNAQGHYTMWTGLTLVHRYIPHWERVEADA